VKVNDRAMVLGNYFVVGVDSGLAGLGERQGQFRG
jgi:hypothetical protein